MDDREAAAAIAAGDPAGIAAAYDMYAAALYGYCQWMLDEPGAAAEAVRDTFAVASAAIGDLADPAKLGPWLYSVARHECQRRLGTVGSGHGGHADADDQPAGGPGRPEAPANDPAGLPDIRGELAPAELVSLIRGILAELPPPEREVIELSLRHNLHDDDLAEALGVSWSRAHSLTERARDRLEKALGTLLIARIGQQDCPELASLLADWDGRLTGPIRDLIAGHIEQCQGCTERRRGSLRAAALSGLLPLAPLPSELREQVLELCAAATPEGAARRQRATRRAGRAWLARVWQTITPTRSARIRANPGRAAVTAAVIVWVVAAASVTMLTFSGSHPAGALTARPSPTQSPSPSPAADPTTALATITRSASPKRSPHRTHSPTFAPPVVSSPALLSPSPSPSAKPSRSPSPSPSASKSPSPSPSPSASGSKSPSPSASPSPTKTG